jgi:hypothetical protein
MQPLLLWKILHILSVCVCVLSYPASKAHALYYVDIRGLSESIFPHYLINGTIKKVTEHEMCIPISSTKF